MGYVLSKIWNKLIGAKEAPIKIVVVGLANSGKTTILYKLAFGEVVVT